jgi:PAS domain S-box-containing protein
METVAEAICVIDKHGIIRFCNSAMETLSGFSINSILGKKCNEIMVCGCRGIEHCSIFSKGVLKNFECSVKRPDNSTVPVLKNGGLLLDEHEKIIGAVQTLTDISVLRNKEQHISELKQKINSQRGFSNIIGKSHRMQEIFELIRLSAASNVTLLITGETGTGKELVAKAVHEKSTRKSHPFIKINCSALPENLLESELFGHAKGSFSGAIKDKIGRFEAADKGTLFIDEVGEVSPLIQIKLLRFLQEKEFERIGENITRHADVRIVAATHRNLKMMIREGQFREDLYYRLKVFPIHLPSLSDRKEDISLLVDHFINRFNGDTGKNIRGLTRNAALLLMDYCWPGNIRELENAIEHAFVTCTDGYIDIFDLPIEIRKVELRKDTCKSSNTNSNKERSEREITELLKKFNGNKSKLARHLGVDRTTIWRKLKKMSN